MPHADKQAMKIYKKKYAAANKDRASEYNKKYAAKNKEKLAAYQKEYKRKNPDKRDAEYFARRMLRINHGITLEQKEEWITFQDHKCAACGTTEPGGHSNVWHLDHNHTTGAKRGILCNGCNMALGFLKDSAEKCVQLAAYVKFKPDYIFEVV